VNQERVDCLAAYPARKGALVIIMSSILMQIALVVAGLAILIALYFAGPPHPAFGRAWIAIVVAVTAGILLSVIRSVAS
jgi:ABC-type multidrug transport system permease subunit